MNTKKIVIGLGLLTASLSYASKSAQDYNYVFFGDSVSDTGSKFSSKLLTKAGKPSIKDYDKANIYYGNNFYAMGDLLGPPNLIGAPISSVDLSSKDKSAKTWVNYFLDDVKNGRSDNLLIYRALKYSPEVDSSKYDLSFASASAQSGENYVNDLNAAYLYDGKPAPYVKCTDDQYADKVSDTLGCTPNGLTQINRFLEVSKDWSKADKSNTRVVLWIGNNDIYNNIMKAINLLDLTKIKNFKELSALISKYPYASLIRNITTSINLLVDDGYDAKNIYLFGIFNFKDEPASHAGYNAFVRVLLSTLSNNINYNIKQVALKHGANYYNVPTVVSKEIAIAEKIPNFNIFNDCTETLRMNQPYSGDEVYPFCKNYLFYNGVHPAEKLQRAIAKGFYDKLTHDS